MGKYINQDSKGNQLPTKVKSEALIIDGATETDASFKENLIAISDSGMFEAAGYMFSEQEFNYFKENVNVVKWLVHPQAKELSQ